jgi:plastocyanin
MRLRGKPMRLRVWMRVRGKAVRGLAAAGAIALVAACGGGTMSPSGGGTPPPNTTITITSSGVSPKNLVVSAGTQVTFVNNSLANHDMYSNPHPEHTDCPEINNVGHITPGQSKQTGNLNTVRTCGYHDHMLFSDTLLQGTITIQ